MNRNEACSEGVRQYHSFSNGWRRAGARARAAGDPTPGGDASTVGLFADRTRHVALAACTFLISLFLWNTDASAFCGFYVGKADTKLFNKASEVVIARHDNKRSSPWRTISKAM